MKLVSRFAPYTLVLALLCVQAFGQAAARPAAPAPAPASTAPAAGTPAPTKIGIISLQATVAGSNEGQRDLQALQKKYEPDVAKLQAMGKEIEDIRTQLKNGDGKLAPEKQQELQSSLESKSTAAQRMQEDLQKTFEREQGVIANRVLSKVAPVLDKFAKDNNFALVLAENSLEDNGRVLWLNPYNGVDITKAVVDAYNVASGVPAPPPSATATKPTALNKPATVPATKPAGSTPR